MSKTHLTIYYDNDRTFTARNVSGINKRSNDLVYHQQEKREDKVQCYITFVVPLADVIGYKIKKGDSIEVVRVKACTMVGGLFK